MKKGFTLIELMVVIAIIALLASIVLSSLNSATNLAHDNSVKAGLRELSTQMQSLAPSGYFGTALNTSTNYCGAVPTGSGIFVDPGIQAILANIISNARSDATFTCIVDSTGSKWTVSVSHLRGSGLSWCVDDSGHFGQLTATWSSTMCM